MKKDILDRCYSIAIEHNTSEKHPEWDSYKHYSFVIQNNQIVSFGMNMRGPKAENVKTYPRKIHAEFCAWKKARGIIDRNRPFEVVNIRLNKRGDLKLSKPCKCCYGFLSQLKCSRIYFSTDVGFAKI